MNRSSELLPAGTALEQILTLLDRIDSRRSDLPPEQRLAWLRTARTAQSRLQALTGVLTAEAETHQAAEQAVGTPITSWIATQEVCSAKEAARDVFAARTLTEHPLISQAATAGSINTNQATAIGKVLNSISPQLDATQKQQAAHELVSLATHLDAGQLARAAGQVLRKVAPADAEHLLETRLQRQAEQAHRARFLRFFPNGGSLRFEGSLPLAEGERFQALITAHREKNRRASLDAGESLADRPSYDQRQADALISLCHNAANAKPEPGLGSARVLVKLDYQQLHQQAAGAGLISDDQPLPAGELRRLCCDAELIPAVLGGASEVLDVGRASRLVTPAIRSALILRDGHCAFPGCEVRPESCEAHHIQPWWNGGRTSLGNLVLLCHHHHGVVEPAKDSRRDQWQVHIADDGKPVLTAPARLQRFGKRGSPPDEPMAAGPDEVAGEIELALL